jgi:gliding motility-associated-like protein
MSNEFEPEQVFTQSGSYDVTLTVTTPEQCSDSLTLYNAINVYPLPTAAFVASPTNTTVLDAEINFIDHSTLATHWNWNFGDGSFSSYSNPSYVYQDTGTFTITLITTSEHQCVDTTYGEVVITGAFTLYIPNAFTPNADGKNDLFSAVGFGITSLEMDIYNRWGNKIFEGKSLNEKWNGFENNRGLACPQGVYVYNVRVRDMFDKPHTLKGRVTLVR